MTAGPAGQKQTNGRVSPLPRPRSPELGKTTRVDADRSRPSPAAIEAAGPAPGSPEGPQVLEILERIDQGFYTIDPDWRLTYVNAAAERFWGRPRGELLGRSMFDLFPKFRGSEPHAAHERAFSEGGSVRLDTFSTATGAPIELGIFPVPGGLSIYFRDVTQRHRMEKELRDRDEILTLAEGSAGIGVWDADLTTQTFQGTPQFFRLMGLEPTAGAVSMDVTRNLRHPDDRARVIDGFRRSVASGRDAYKSEYRIIRPDGETRWIFGRGRVIRDAAGTPVRYAGIDIDITERKRQDEQMRIVLRELVHRTNNLLAVIQAMAHQTAITSIGMRDFEQRFSARLRGLAHSNELLVRQDWRGGAMDALVQTQLAPFVGADTGRLVLDGPPLLLRPEAVQNIGLALHELATNASKYGALSRPDGKIRIAWRIDDPGAEAARFHLSWREEGGPPVKPPRRKGFGRFVVETMIARALDAAVTIDFAPDGFVWMMSVAAHQVLARDGVGPLGR